MAQESIGQRIKFLIDSQKISVRRFAQSLDVGETNIRNYIDKGTKPSSDVLEKISRTFTHVNLVWLITGDGEPFIPDSSNPSQVHEHDAVYSKNFSHSQVIGTNKGKAIQQQRVIKAEGASELSMLQDLVEQLKSQLADKERLIQFLLSQQPK